MSQYESFHLWGEGRFCYDDEKVNRSKELIKEAEKELDQTKESFNRGFVALLNVANIEKTKLAENIRENQTIFSGLPGELNDYLEELYKMVNSKQEEIETYKNASGWDKFWSTVGMAGSKFLEGIASVGENIIDAGATIVGSIGGLVNKDFQDSCAEFIKKDHVGDAFHQFNEATGLTKYSAMSEYGTAAKIFKGAGTIVGYAVVGSFTGGALGVSATTANTIVAASAGLGSGMEQGLNEGKNWGDALGGATKQAIVQGGTAYVMGKFSEKVQTQRAMKASGGKNADIVEQAGKNVKDAKNALSKARKDYAWSNKGVNAQGVSTKDALKAAKVDLKNARNIQQFVEKESIAGKVFTDNSALNHIQAPDNGLAYKLGEKTGETLGKAGEKINNGVLKKFPGVKTTEALVEKGRSIGMSVGTSAEKLTNKIVDNNIIGNKLAGQTANVIDKGSKVINKIDDVIGGAASKSNIATNHPILTKAVSTVASVPNNLVSTTVTTVAKNPTIFKTIGNENIADADQAKKRIDEEREGLDNAGRKIDDPIPVGPTPDANIDAPAARDDGYVEPTTTPSATNNSLSDSGYTAYQPNVAARQVSSSGGGYTASSRSSGGGYTGSSRSSGGGYTGSNYSSGGGATYTPTYTATSTPTPSVENVEPVSNTSPASSTSSNSYTDTVPRTTTTSTPSTTSTSTTSSSSGSTGNSNAVIDTFSNSTGGSSTSGNNTGSYTYEEPVRSTTTYSSSGTTHSGGGYSSGGYSFSGSDVESYSDTATSIDPTDLITEDTSMTSTSGTLASSITSTNKFNNQTIKIPTSSESVTSSSSNMAIPTAAAFSAAAAAGIGAKAYIDKKEREKEESEETFDGGNENAGFSSDNWDGNEDDIKVDYGTEDDETLDDDSYSAASIIEKYEAVSNDELEEA